MAEEEIEISDLELKEELNGDDLLPIETSLSTFATTLTKIKDWMANFFISESGVRNIISTTLGDIYPVGSVYIGTQTTCPMASKINGSTWELVASGRALWTGDGTNGGTTIAAGLPNITGTFGATDGLSSSDAREVNFNTASGAFSLNKSTNNFGTWDSSRNVNGGKTVSFNASQSSSIYGNSSTVQPPAYVVNVWRRTE